MRTNRRLLRRQRRRREQRGGQPRLGAATSRVVKQFADLLSTVASAASDSKINQREARDIRREWKKLKRVAEGYVKCCEQGNFKQLNREMKMQKYLNTTRQGALPPRV